jgi:sulfotransferase family protein
MRSALAKQWWTAERFGVTPRKLAGRATRAGLPRVLVVSLPKAGTHLVERAVCLHPRLYRRFLPTLNPENVGAEGLAGAVRAQRPGQVLVAHLPFDPSYPALLEDVKTLFVIRDPRDVAVSLAHYIGGRGDHPLHFAYSARPDERSRIELAVLGDADARPPAPALESLLASFSGWLESGAAVVRFEELIGSRGGGDDDVQERTIRTIYDHLGMRPPARVSERLFSSASPTFRKGRIGAWREAFDPELEALFEREAGPWMEIYGYR